MGRSIESLFSLISTRGIPKGSLFKEKVFFKKLFLNFSYAYIEFEDAEGVENAKLLSDSLLRGRQIKVFFF